MPGVLDSSSAYADEVHPIDHLLGLNPTNLQAKVMTRCFGAAETPTNTCNMLSVIVMLKHSTIDIHVWNDMILNDLVMRSDACQCTCHMHKSHPTTMMDSWT